MSGTAPSSVETTRASPERSATPPRGAGAACSWTSDLCVRLAGPQDEQALLQLHHEGFGSHWAASEWRRRFVGNPTGRTAIAGAFAADGRCVAAFCGVPLAARYRGEPGSCTRAGDVVVHPKLRQSVVGSKVLVRTGTLFFDTFGGGATRIVYGCPELGLRRTAVRHLRCDVWGDLPVLLRELDAEVVAAPGIAVDEIDAWPEGLDRLLTAHGERHPTGLVRDQAFLRWRSPFGPSSPYRWLAARDPNGVLRGVAIVRAGGLHDEALSLVDWFAEPGDDEAESALLAHAVHVARREGLHAVAACFSPMSPAFVHFQLRHRFYVRMSHHQIVFRSYAAGHDRRFLLDEWSYSMSDFDFG